MVYDKMYGTDIKTTYNGQHHSIDKLSLERNPTMLL